MSKQKNVLLFVAAAIVLALLISAIAPASVLADGETPPPAAETPAQEEVEESAESAEAVEPQPEENAAVEETPPLSELLESLPPDTQVIALDESGAALSLASQEAAEVLVSGDPMWCPSGILPGGAGCTPSQASFTALKSLLVTEKGTYSGNGVIYVDKNYVAPQADKDFAIVFNYQDLALGNLTVKGGWNFLSNQQEGDSTLNGISSLSFLNWNNNLTLNNLTIANAGGLGSSVTVSGGSGDVTVQNVAVQDSLGMSITTSAGEVVVSNSSFTGNEGDGLFVNTGGSATLTNVAAQNNEDPFNPMDAHGVFVQKASGGLTVSGGNFSNNSGNGLYLGGAGAISLTGVTASGNGNDGLTTFGNANVWVYNSSFNNNGQEKVNIPSLPGRGVDVGGAGSLLTVECVTASGNPGEGVYTQGTLVDKGCGTTPPLDPDDEPFYIPDMSEKDYDNPLDELINDDPNKCAAAYLALGNSLSAAPQRQENGIFPATYKTSTPAETSIDLETLYRVRDEILAKTPQGMMYVRLYYGHGAELVSLLAANSNLREEARSVLLMWQPNLRALADGKGADMVIVTAQVQTLETFLDHLRALASPELQAAIDAERAKHPLSDAAGLTMLEAADMLGVRP
ncbi:MAG: right-handed parallel beta-helix repeat-containing protein [Chloroflexi bacterium]|nr:right-handed parallel beta-helix repeat-containing protein [Chloroflexota bacterium]MCA2000772.1 right-handed parallel beta-helix repeat-containing protein [Chloroflexota bacterium]